MSFLDLQSVHKSYGPVMALRGINLAVPTASRTAIVGPSGSGKTTLLRIVAGFEVPDAGTVTLDGRVLADGPSAVPAYRRGIGYVPQDGALFPHLSIADNIGFGLPQNIPGRSARIGELAAMVALETSLLQRRPHELSGGQQQRVALARALAQQPRLMLLDEPFSALDTGLRASTRKATADLLRAAGITTILVTHDQAEALSFADQVAVMREGVLVQAGSPREVYSRPLDPGIAAFLGDVVLLKAELAGGLALCQLGRIAVDDNSRTGPADIMLRPEQFRLRPRTAAKDDAGGCHGEVLDIDFGGQVAMLSIRVENGPPAGYPATDNSVPLQVRVTSQDLPVIGSRVWIEVLGQAHAFAGPAHISTAGTQ